MAEWLGHWTCDQEVWGLISTVLVVCKELRLITLQVITPQTNYPHKLPHATIYPTTDYPTTNHPIQLIAP